MARAISDGMRLSFDVRMAERRDKVVPPLLIVSQPGAFGIMLLAKCFFFFARRLGRC